MPRTKTMHHVPHDDPGKRIGRALCGVYVNRVTEHAAKPEHVSCEACKEAMAYSEQLADEFFGGEAHS